MKQLHLWGPDETLGTILDMACSACGTQAPGMAEAFARDVLAARDEGAGPALPSDDDGAEQEFDLTDDELTDAQLRDGFREWQDTYAEEVCIPRWGPI